MGKIGRTYALNVNESRSSSQSIELLQDSLKTLVKRSLGF